MGKVKLNRLGFCAFFIVAGCAQHHCREIPKLENRVVSPTAGEDGSGSQRTVLVYKYDGSLQCGQGKAIGLDEMARDLKGIRIISKQKRPDGLMHIQVCGSPTGIANVFEISESDLAKAERAGFKRWSFE